MPSTSRSCLSTLLLTTLLLLFAPVHAIKFEIQAHRYPPSKCIWNSAHRGALVIVTANVGPGEGQRLDIEIVDSGAEKNVYLRKRAIEGEARFAITAHSEDGDVGVCFKNYLDVGECGRMAPRPALAQISANSRGW
jgi:p24 family protein delta-1